MSKNNMQTAPEGKSVNLGQALEEISTHLMIAQQLLSKLGVSAAEGSVHTNDSGDNGPPPPPTKQP